MTRKRTILSSSKRVAKPWCGVKYKSVREQRKAHAEAHKQKLYKQKRRLKTQPRKAVQPSTKKMLKCTEKMKNKSKAVFTPREFILEHIKESCDIGSD